MASRSRKGFWSRRAPSAPSLAADGARFGTFAGETAPLAGLDRAARYRVSLHAQVALSAAALTGRALRPPAVYPETMLVLAGARL